MHKYKNSSDSNHWKCLKSASTKHEIYMKSRYIILFHMKYIFWSDQLILELRSWTKRTYASRRGALLPPLMIFSIFFQSNEKMAFAWLGRKSIQFSVHVFFINKAHVCKNFRRSGFDILIFRYFRSFLIFPYFSHSHHGGAVKFSSAPPITLSAFCSFLVFSPSFENAENSPLGLPPSPPAGAATSIGTTLFDFRELLLFADCLLADLDCRLAARLLLAELFAPWARDCWFLDLFRDFMFGLVVGKARE